jgi:GxxExxY protein
MVSLGDLYVISATSAVKIFSVLDRTLTGDIIGAAIRIHRGPGLLESAYEACLAYELSNLGYTIERQKPVPLVYEAVRLDCGSRADIVVGGRVAVELKGKEILHPVDEAQPLSHMRLLQLALGILINFHVVLLKDRIRRLVNDYSEPLEAQVTSS